MDKIYQVNLDDLKKKAKIAEKSTKKLFQKLKTTNYKTDLDKTFHQIHYNIFDIKVCLDCANCCKTIGPILYNIDIERMARALKIKSSEFINQYIAVDEDNDYIFNSKPCPFLDENNYCIIYENRPKACREYPHTDRKRMYQILDLTIKNTYTCPAVYKIVEELKQTIKLK
ncbi:YkgJ family cysteine cluster protein [Bacteroidota bacterium]